MAFIPDDSGAVGKNLIAYGEPGSLGVARLPIKANQSAKIIQIQVKWNTRLVS